MISIKVLGRVTVAPPPPRTVLRIPWGRATEAPDTPGLTALTCAALFGVDGYRIGHRYSAVSLPPTVSADQLEVQMRTVDLAALRRALAVRRAHRLGDRAWLARRAVHLAAWGDACIDALVDPAAGGTAVSRQHVIELAREIVRYLGKGVDQESPPDILEWRGGLYYGARNQHRLAVAVQLPWSASAPDVTIAAAYLGRVGAPGVLARTLAQRQVPYYAAAALPLWEHGMECLSIGLSTTADHVAPMVAVVRAVLCRIRDTGIPDAQLAHLRACAALYEAIHPSDDPFEHRAEIPFLSLGPHAPAVAVVGRLPDVALARLREAVHGW